MATSTPLKLTPLKLTPPKPSPLEIEDLHKKFEATKINAKRDILHNMDLIKLEAFTIELSKQCDKEDLNYNQISIEIRRKFHICPNKGQIKVMYQQLVSDEKLKRNYYLEEYLIKRMIRATSGVTVITIFTSPTPSFDIMTPDGPVRKTQKFSCKFNCHYCPKEPGQPRSYLTLEPAVLRANHNDFDAVKQIHSHAELHESNFHDVDKIEILVLGGTWCSYPVEYQREFIRDTYYAANTFHSRAGSRDRLSLAEEKKLNETAKCRIIGLTLETRPDTINDDVIIRFREYGCTRVQLGVQHTDDEILKKINRRHTVKEASYGIQLLKDNSFKVDIHIMPDLPGSSPAKDKTMFDYILNSPDIQADQWKIYPCEIVPWTRIKRWFELPNDHPDKYTPYSPEELMELLIYVKSQVHPWIRLNRVIRDIPNEYIHGGNNVTNLRQIIQQTMKDQGLICNCIRCREVRNQKYTEADIELVTRSYRTTGGTEYFISFENKDRSTIYGFTRLRIPDDNSNIFFDELHDCALIRELHVYGRNMSRRKGIVDNIGNVQHLGLGKRLLEEAERMAVDMRFKKISVISGVGVREYYRKRGYTMRGDGDYLIKDF
jgi:ELP3 family radical SAM enzyme/protein acetyltransferase